MEYTFYNWTVEEAAILLNDRDMFIKEISKFIPDLTKIPYEYFKALVNVWYHGNNPDWFGVLCNDWYERMTK